MHTKDLKIDTFSNSSPKVAIRITHIPTGTIVAGEGVGMYRTKNRLTKELEEKISGK